MVIHPDDYKITWNGEDLASLILKDVEYKIIVQSPRNPYTGGTFNKIFQIGSTLYSVHYKRPNEVFRLTDTTAQADFLKSRNYNQDSNKEYLKQKAVLDNYLHLFDYMNWMTSKWTFSLADADNNMSVSFAVKVSKHLLTIITILNNRDVFFKNIDYDAMKILLRVIFECINLFHYLYIGRADWKEVEMYVTSWRLKNLVSANKTNNKLEEPQSETYTASVIAIEEMINSFILKIESNPYFDSLTDNQKKMLRKGECEFKKSKAELGHWLLDNSNFINSKYSVYCSAIHTDANSIGINTVSTEMQPYVEYQILLDMSFLIFLLTKFLTDIMKHYEKNLPYYYDHYFKNHLCNNDVFKHCLYFGKCLEESYNLKNSEIYQQ